jgi:DNA-directed RNA polymerase specialized sigma24 family protein
VPFEPLKLKLIDDMGRQVSEPVQATVIRAFERAVRIPDANIDHLVSGASRVARVIAAGGATKPEEYASTVLSRIARQSQRDFVDDAQLVSLEECEAGLHATIGPDSSRVLAGIEIERLLKSLDDRERKIVIMRSRDFRFGEIAAEMGMYEASVRCLYHLAKKRLGKIAGGKR